MKLQTSQGDLLQQCQKMANVMDRDLSMLKDYEITEEVIANFRAETEAYRLQMNDSHYKTLLEKANAQKAAVRTSLIKQVQYILRRVSSLYTYGSVESHFFGVGSFRNLIDSELMRNTINMLEAAKPRLDDLKRRNVQQKHLDDLETQIQLFEQSIAEVYEKKNLRLTARETRLANGLQLQEKLGMYADAGKLALEEVSTYANYKDYVLSAW